MLRSWIDHTRRLRPSGAAPVRKRWLLDDSDHSLTVAAPEFLLSTDGWASAEGMSIFCRDCTNVRHRQCLSVIQTAHRAQDVLRNHARKQV